MPYQSSIIKSIIFHLARETLIKFFWSYACLLNIHKGTNSRMIFTLATVVDIGCFIAIDMDKEWDEPLYTYF